VGGMTRALVRHHPINWTFHWRGICRAITSESLPAQRCVRARHPGTSVEKETWFPAETGFLERRSPNHSKGVTLYAP
jgi:hypothetical protein